MSLEELEKEVSAIKETIQELLVRLRDERDARQLRDAPIGTIVAFAGPKDRVPASWLVCDGTSRRADDLPLLRAAISTSWGAGDDPPNTFSLPSLAGRFLRGVDEDGGVDTDGGSRDAAKPGGNVKRAVGSVQGDQFASHAHGVTDNGHRHDIIDPGHAHGFSAFRTDGAGGVGQKHPSDPNNFGTAPAVTGISIQANTTGVSLQNSGGNETRPKNAYVYWIIKADPD